MTTGTSSASSMRPPHLELLLRVEPVERRRALGIEHRDEPLGTVGALRARPGRRTPRRGGRARAWATIASTRSARITSTSTVPSLGLLVRECSGQQVPVGRYSGDRVGGDHPDQHRAGQAVGRGGADGGGQRRLRRERGRCGRNRLGRPRWRRWPARTPYRRPPGCAPGGWCGRARRERCSRRAGRPPGSARRRSRPPRWWCSAGSAAIAARRTRRLARRAAASDRTRRPGRSCHGRPVAWSTTLPAEFTATSAPTVTPDGSVVDAVPTPPLSTPARAPTPAPTVPTADPSSLRPRSQAA